MLDERPARKAKRKPKRTTDPEDAGTGIYIGSSTKKALKAYHATLQGQTYSDIALDALEWADDRGQLGEWLTVGEKARTGSLFRGRRSRKQRHHEDQVAVTLRLDPADVVTIDDMVQDSGATNRSHLINIALRHYLPARMGAEWWAQFAPSTGQDEDWTGT